jgi:flagellar M-ring protein FliF
MEIITENFNKIKQQVSGFWQSRSRAQKIKLFLSAFLIITAIIIFFYIISHPTYAPLYTNLETKDAAQIVKKLDDMNISYRLDDDGKTILVEPKDVYKTRLVLAQDGLPKGGTIGFSDILDKTKLGTTDWERQIQYNQALQGELIRTIEEMENIEKATVNIVKPEKTPFIIPDNQTEPSAAVFLKTKTGDKLSEEEVRGIIFLVAHSVEGLQPENITVIDEYGRILSNISLDLDDKTSLNSQLELQNEFQNQLQSSVQSLLEQVFGPGNVAVRVNSQLNFDKKTVESKLFSPVDDEEGEGILRSIQDLREHFTGSGNPTGGVPGVDPNTPGYQEITGGDSTYQKSDVIKNYEINESIENLNVAPGAVKKLTVSVVVNRTLNESEKNSISQMVGNAIGYDPERDQITVEGMTFNTDLTTTLAEQITKQEQQKSLIKKILISAILILIIVALVMYKRRNDRKRKIEEEKLAQEMIAAQQEVAKEAPAQAAGAKEDQIYNNVKQYARHKPEDVAEILRTWLKED